ncbi:MAG: archaeosine biosynthesis radical SAM protein RaSEA [Thermoplasmata archaeon]
MTLENIIKRFRKPGKRSPKKYVTTWTEKEVLNDRVVECYVIVLRTKGCYWSRMSGCSMCGYINDCAEDASPVDISMQFQNAMKAYAGQRYLKIYTSGSFLDEEEIEKNTGLKMLKTALSQADSVLIETRPEFISKQLLENLPNGEGIEIAMGLESANNVVLQKSISKRMVFEDFKNACKICKDLGIRTRAYVLIKPPFLTEKEAMMDAISSARLSSDLVDTISFNPVNVQRNTLVEYLWRRGEYRPPWLWTLLEVIESLRNLGPRILVSTVGAGEKRGAHNCGQCDSVIIDFLKDFSLDELSSSPKLECNCRDEWLDLLDTQGPMQCSADPASFFDR